MRQSCHLNIIKINKYHINNTNQQSGFEQFLGKRFRPVSSPVQGQFAGIVKKHNHEHNAKQHKLERQGIPYEKDTHHSQCNHITNNGFIGKRLGEKCQHIVYFWAAKIQILVLPDSIQLFLRQLFYTLS